LAASASPLAEGQPPHGDDGEALEGDAQADRGGVVADVLGAQDQPAGARAEPEDGELGDYVAESAPGPAVRHAGRGDRVARLARRVAVSALPAVASLAPQAR
jgi:hypothetical protein